jgi:hypothetical protein
VNIIDLINRFILWLQARPVINLFLVIAYFLFILLMHDTMVHVSLWIEARLSLPTYNLVIEAVFVMLVLLLGATLFMRFKINFKDLKLEFAYLFLTLLFIIVHSRFMFDSNIEVIHSFEYSILVFLIFPFTRRFGAAILFALPFMLIDEWYQYRILYPTLDYFDLNDIMMDTYGCGLTMTLLMTFGIKGSNAIKPFWKRPEFISLICLLVVVLIAVKICLIAPYNSDVCGNTLLVLNQRMTSEPFLRPHPTHHIMFHVMKPVEAMIAITGIHLFYFGLDSFRKTA